MNACSAFRCLSLATIGFAASFSIVAAAQEEQAAVQQGEAQEEAQQEEPRQAPVQRLFVDDKLVLNVYSGPDQGGDRVATIETGDAVDELERADASVRVRLEDGREGWVGANYLTTDAPAVVRVRELERQQKSAAAAAEKKSTDEIARLRKQNTALEGELKKLQTSIAAAPVAAAEAAPLEDEFEDFEREPQPVAATPSADAGSAFWIALLAALLAGSAGFAAGYQMLARRIRKKFGGLKIY